MAAFQVPAALRARAEGLGIKFGTKVVVSFAYPDGEEITTVQAPWSRYPEEVFDTYRVKELICIAASPIEK